MAEQIISPGVFTRENDLSFLPAGVGAIGAAIVGPTVKGPAFVPTVVNSFADFQTRFGDLDPETYENQYLFYLNVKHDSVHPFKFVTTDDIKIYPLKKLLMLIHSIH